MKERGYEGAKIIVNGKYEEGVGGGVCQASTTLYNACLVSGLEIVEANPHSLKSSYVSPGFDAMVNFGSSDLKVKNNTENPVVFACKCDGERCCVYVYGEENPYKISRRSEIIREILPNEDEIVCASEGQNPGEYIVHPKLGVESESFLDYYDGDILVATKKLRHNVYNAINGVKVADNNENV